jgi:glutamate 5-kinase
LTKSSIARKVAKEGIAVHIANGLRDEVLTDILSKEREVKHTYFKAEKRKSSNVKKWIAYSHSFAKGELIINQGAREALFSTKATSLLPIGVIEVKGLFKRGDIEKGRLVGWGKSQYSAEKVKAEGESSKQKPVVHYDYLYLSED